MNKFLISFVFVLSCLSVKAQSQDSRSEDSILTQRIDSLEHELLYLKLSYDLYTLNADITNFSNELYTRNLSIRLDIYNRNFDSALGNAYLSYLEACQQKKQSISDLIDAKKTFFTIKVFSYPFSEVELNALWASYRVVNNAYDAMESSMNMLKNTIETYKRMM